LCVDSEEHHDERELAKNAIDGNPSTHRHTEYRDRQTSHLHDLIIDLAAHVDGGRPVVPVTTQIDETPTLERLDGEISHGPLVQCRKSQRACDGKA